MEDKISRSTIDESTSNYVIAQMKKCTYMFNEAVVNFYKPVLNDETLANLLGSEIKNHMEEEIMLLINERLYDKKDFAEFILMNYNMSKRKDDQKL